MFLSGMVKNSDELGVGEEDMILSEPVEGGYIGGSFKSKIMA